PLRAAGEAAVGSVHRAHGLHADGVRHDAIEAAVALNTIVVFAAESERRAQGQLAVGVEVEVHAACGARVLRADDDTGLVEVRAGEVVQDAIAAAARAEL